MAQMDISKWATSNMSGDHKMETDDLPNGESGGGKKGANKRLSVERIYQKKTQLEHILLRPDTYIGTIERLNDQESWVYDEEDNCMRLQKLSYVPGLYKIFDEILVNAADNKQRDPKMNAIKIDIDRENNRIKIWNNGKGIPVVNHEKEKVYVPTLIFGHLLTSSNYDDSEKKVTGGRNGYGAKLCNIFSTKFTVETSCKEYGKHFKQSWSDNMSKAGEPKIQAAKSDDFTCITFQPDLKRFGMESLEEDICKVFRRRAYDIAAAVKGVKVFLNGTKLPISNFADYVLLFLKTDQDGKLKHHLLSTPKDFSCTTYKDSNNDRWEVLVAPSERGFQQMSFVNSIATTKGGRHVDYVTDQITKKLVEHVEGRQKKKGEAKKQKPKKGEKKTTKGPTIKPFQVKGHLWVFVNCQIENPTFDSQTKENMTLQPKNFGSKCEIPDTFMNRVYKTEVVQLIMNWIDAKERVELQRTSGGKGKKLRGIAKLDDANLAKGKNSYQCTLILTEGDSAKTLAVAGVSELYKGRDYYGVFPLRGKLLNVRDIGNRMLSTNQEISDIVKIIGLDYKCKYETEEEWKKLRYGRLMIMTDQDQDGSHIKGLIINFIHSKWPGLIRRDFIEQFITPIIKVWKGKNGKKIPFYTIPEFEEWRQKTPDSHRYAVKYYKGLGTSTHDEGKQYFLEMERNRIQFYYTGSEDDANINLAFSKKKIEERKEWLTNYMEERKRRRQLGLPDLYLYNKETKRVNFSEFINRELILFSNTDNERSIPSIMDGFKPGQRKVMFVCFKRNLTQDIKVSQLAGSVSELSAYHHGEQSLMMTIVNLAQDFTGSNNLNLLNPGGQFGSRLKMGKDSASPRYITTKLEKLTRFVFIKDDEKILTHNYDDNKKVEPDWYCPIIPMVLVNGAEGIGTGWSTKVLNYDVREIVRNLLRMIDGEEPREMMPYWRGYRGTIEKLDDTRYLNSGEIAITDESGQLEITEIPIRMSTSAYKEQLEFLLTGEKNTLEGAGGGRRKKDDADDDADGAAPAKKEKKEQPLIKDYQNHCDTDSIKFDIVMDQAKLQQCEAQGLHKVFKLQTTLSTNSMVLFDADGVLRRYDSVLDILREFFRVRLEMYAKRKQFMEGYLAAMCLKFDNVVRFITEKIDGIIVVENKKKVDIIQVLVRRGYDPDPEDEFKKSQAFYQDNEEEDERKKRRGGDDLLKDDEEEEKQQEDDSGAEEDIMETKKNIKHEAEDKKKVNDSRFDYLLTLPILSLTKERRQKIGAVKAVKEDKMYKLQKTSIQDMWRNDLNTFLEELEKYEEKKKQKKEETKTTSRKKQAKDKKGRGASWKNYKDETAPTPNARRVVPRVDAGMRQKAAAAAKSKLKAQNKKDALSRELLEDMKTEADSDDELGLNKSLTDRLGALKSEPLDVKPKVKQEKKPRKPREPKEPRDLTKKSPKKKKRNPWSSDSEVSDDDVSDGMMSDSDDDVSGLSAPSAPRQPSNRRGAAKAKYTFGDDDSDADSSDGGAGDVNGADNDANDDWKNAISDDSDFSPTKSSQETNQSKKSDSEPEEEPDLWSRIVGNKSDNRPEPSRPKSPIFGADSDDDRLLNDEPFEVEPAAPKPAAVAPTGKKTLGKKTAAPKAKKEAKPRAAPKRKNISVDSDSDKPRKKTSPKKKGKKKDPWDSDASDDDDDFPSKPAKKRGKKSAESDSEDDFKPKKAKGKPKKKSAMDSSDEDDELAGIDAQNIVPRAGGRARKQPVSYNFGDSEEDSDF